MTDTRDISVGIKTFMRTPQLRLCLDSLRSIEWREVIVADDGPIDEEREELYRSAAEALPLKLLRLPFDTGLAAGRNEIVRQCGTPYLLMLDDDQTVPANVGLLADILDENPVIGGASAIWLEHGDRKCTACDLRLVGSRIVKEVCDRHPVRHTKRGQRYVTFAFIPNSTLFRRDCLTELPWDPFYKIGKEHLDFYFSHQRLGRWQFAVSLDVLIGHHPEDASSTYQAYRHGPRVDASNRYFLEKFGVSKVVEGRKLHDCWWVVEEGPVREPMLRKLTRAMRGTAA
ncbi:MAG TPA: glycosyltransferase [Steroidobacteraceae bacterium]